MSTRITLGAHALNVRIDGAADAPPIVLSNSLGANLSMWDTQIAALSTKYRVVRYDTRGHGQSDAPEGPYTLNDLQGDVIALMDHLGIETAAFMGLSMGGMTGLGLGLAHPQRFSRIVCADARADAPPPFRDMWDQRIAKVAGGGLAAIADGTLEGWLTAEWRAANPEGTGRVREMVLGNTAEGYIACCRALQGLDYLKDLPRMTVPTLFVGGDQDMGAAPAVMQAMADATPSGMYIAISNAAHVANINAPDAFNAAISGFLGLD